MKKIIYGLLSFSPVLAFAQGSVGNANLSTFKSLTTQIGEIIRILIPMAFGLAVLFFFWGVAQFVLAAGDEKANAAGKSKMIYGVVAIAVMASLFGLVNWLQGVFGVSAGSSTITPPTIQNL
jgi:Type IV secretion system pilin